MVEKRQLIIHFQKTQDPDQNPNRCQKQANVANQKDSLQPMKTEKPDFQN